MTGIIVMLNSLMPCIFKSRTIRSDILSSDQTMSSCTNFRRVRFKKPDLLTQLPIELRINIADRLPLPTLLNLRKVNKVMRDTISKDMLINARNRYDCHFQHLKIPFPSAHSKNQLTSEMITSKIYNCANINIKQNNNNSRHNLKVQCIEGIDDNGAITAGRFDNGLFFIYVDGEFEEYNMRLSIIFGGDNKCLYIGNTYEQIATFIKNNRNDTLAHHIQRILQYTKEYF